MVRAGSGGDERLSEEEGGVFFETMNFHYSLANKSLATITDIFG